MILEYTKTLVNTDKFHLKLKELYPTKYTSFSLNGSSISIIFSSDLTDQEQIDCASFVSGFADYTSAESLALYLEFTVHPFIKSLINDFAAENISMGITYYGKTGHVLSLFSKFYPVPNSSFPNSLKNSFDTGSLYISVSIIQYIRDNPSEFSEITPFITDARLHSMKNKIEAFLGVALT